MEEEEKAGIDRKTAKVAEKKGKRRSEGNGVNIRKPLKIRTYPSRVYLPVDYEVDETGDDAMRPNLRGCCHT